MVKRSTYLPSTSFFDDFSMRDLFDWPAWSNERSTLPRVNISETNDEFRVELAAPGMNKDDFHIELDNDTLTIHSEVSGSTEEKEQEFTRREFSYQSFRRSFYLPNTVQADKIRAKYQDGILRLQIPKKEEARNKPAKKIVIS